MDFARLNEFIVLCDDLDFGSILAATHGRKPNIVQIRAADVSPDIIGKQVIAGLRQMAPEPDQGALVTIDPGRTRLSILPFRTGE